MRKAPKRWSARIASVLFSPRWAGRGGWALVAGGLLGLLAHVAFVLMFGAFPVLASGLAYGLLDVVFLLRGSFVLPLIAVGLVGLYALTGRRPGRLRRISGAGLGLVLVSALVLAGLNVYETLLAPRYIAYGPDQGVPLPREIEVWAEWGWPIGIVLLGIEALRARRLGRWRVLPSALGLLSTPVVSSLLYHVMAGGNPRMGVEGAAVLVLDAQPVLLDLGWILLGYGLLRARGAESSQQANERLARRLYEEAWGRGELGVLDELAALDVVDHYYGQQGLDNLKRSIAGLRVSFPDLRFVLEGQEAEEDRVTTRWTMGGTDEGGVLWYPPTGRAATFSGTFTDRFEGGRLVERWGESDTEALLRRLGLPPKG